jgi:nucleoside-diphosphate-sugar epimerase
MYGQSVGRVEIRKKKEPKERKQMNLSKSKVLVTGGASFIGSTLVDALVGIGAQVRVVDNLSSGKLENISRHLKNGTVEFVQADLLSDGVAAKAVRKVDVVFHLAADHGGRGYVDLHQAACATNLVLDGQLFRACREAGTEKIVYASSGCVYPNHLQTDVTQELYLAEDMAGPPFDADNMYGWAKLMGEMTLAAYRRDYGMKSVSCRYFTVYGERGHENHAVIAMIARAFVKQNPFQVWGNGEQIRNWTYVGDIVAGTIRAAEIVEDASAVNLGTMERTRVMDAVQEVQRYTGRQAEIKMNPEMPTGPMNRVADNSLAKRLLQWEPQMKFIEGLHRTIDWYFSEKNPAEVKATLERLLTERTTESQPPSRVAAGGAR